MLLYTDGLSEARRPTDRAFFPLEREAARALAASGAGADLSGTDLSGADLSGTDLSQGVLALREAARAWTGDDLHDDVALVAVQVPW